MNSTCEYLPLCSNDRNKCHSKELAGFVSIFLTGQNNETEDFSF